MPTCVVIQPFDDENDKRYKEVYKPALEEARVEPYRVDHDPKVEVPIETLEERIRKSDICLADITTDNPNVWYELGFAFGVGCPVVMICKEARLDKLPFDVRHRAVIKYATESPSDFEHLRTEIVNRVTATLDGTGPIATKSGEVAGIGLQEVEDDNHFKAARGNREVFEAKKTGHSASEKQRGVAAGHGWLRSVTIEESPVFARGSTLDLGRITVLLGGNASGKTAICEWLAGSGDVSLLKRWSAHGKPTGRTQVRFDAVTPVPLTWIIRVFGESNIQFEIDGEAVPRLNLAQAFVYVSERPRRMPEETTSRYLARWLHIDVAHIHNIVRSLAMRGGCCVHHPRFVTQDDHEALLLDLDGTHPGLDFRFLSSSEQIQVVVEFAVEIARFEAERKPTILLIECMAEFERAMFQEYLDFLATRSEEFQILVTARDRYGIKNRSDGKIEGPRVVRLLGRAPDVKIS